MGNEWPLVKLGDFVQILTGHPFKSKDYSEHEGIRLLRGDNIAQGTLRWQNVKLLPQEKIGEKEHNYFLRTGDVILAMDRPWIEAGLKTAQINENDLPCLLVQRVACLRCEDPSDQDFIRYIISSYGFVQYVKLIQTGTAVPHISGKQIKDYEFRLPPKSVRKQIGRIVKQLDDKANLNRQINQTLEQMARTLFKSWFVDFDPVIDNALDAGNPIPDELQHRAEARQAVRESEGFKPLPEDVRQLFPDAFEESELGWVPKGWGVSTAGDEFTVKGGSTPSTKNAEFWEGGDIHWTSPKDLSGKAEKIMLDTERKITAAGLKKITSGLLPENSVLMSSRAPIGYLALAKIPVAINQGYIAIPSTTRLSQEYVLYWLDSSIDEIKGIAGGTTFAEISKHTFKSIKMIVPDSKVTDIFSNLAKGYLDKITLNVKEVATLTKLRDTLLPKLISGELRLDEVELAVEQEAVSAEQQNER